MLYQQFSHISTRPSPVVQNSTLHVDTGGAMHFQKPESSPSSMLQPPSLLRGGFIHKNSAFHTLPGGLPSAEEVLKSSWMMNNSPAGLGHIFEPGIGPPPGSLMYPSFPSPLHLNMSAWMQMRQQLTALLLYQQQESMKSNQEEQEKLKHSELWSPNLSNIIPSLNPKIVGGHLPPPPINSSDHSQTLKELTINTQEPMEAKSVQTNFKEDPGYDETNVSTAASSQTNTSSSSPEKKRRKSIFQDGVTVGYTIDAFFVSDGRSRRHSSNPSNHQRSSNSPPTTYVAPPRQRYTCTECGKDYATSSNLSRHKQTHRSLDSKLAKTCPHCDKVYVSMPALSMHILTHDLKHTCDICGKAFSRPWLLQGHRRAHTGEKPYGCAHCGRAFADRSNLRAHMQTHSIGKHFDCQQCGKNFSLKSYLTKHLESSGCTEMSPSNGSSSGETQTSDNR